MSALDLAVAKVVLDRVTDEELCEAAQLALEEGIESRALRLLADPKQAARHGARPLLKGALKELGLSMPSASEAKVIVGAEYAKEIADGTVSPLEGAKRIAADLCEGPDVPGAIFAFKSLLGEYEHCLELAKDEANREGALYYAEQHKEAIVAAAQRLVFMRAR